MFALTTALRSCPGIAVDAVLLNEGLLAERLREAGVPVTVADERRHGLGSLVCVVRRHIRRTGTQVLHSHRYKENLIAALTAASLTGLRTLRTVHGSAEDAPGARTWKRRLVGAIDHLGARFVQRPVVCVSERLRRELSSALPSDRLTVIPNGIDIESSERAAGPIVARPGTPFRVGFLGRLSPVKRVDLILDIAAALARETPGAFEFVIAGEGPLREDLEARVRRDGIGGVRFLGFVDRPGAVLRQLDAMLLTSDHEGLPMIVLEAMVLGVPVVSHAVGGIPDALGGDAGGVLLPDQDPKRYAEALRALRADPARARAAAAHAAARVRAEFSSRTMAARYAALYAARP